MILDHDHDEGPLTFSPYLTILGHNVLYLELLTVKNTTFLILIMTILFYRIYS